MAGELLAAEMRTEADFRAFLDRLEQAFEACSAQVSELMFAKYRDKRAPDGLEQAEHQRAELLRNQRYHEVIQQFQGRLSDPLLGRRAEMWDKSYRAARVSELPEVIRLRNAITDRIVGFRYDVQGEQVDLGTVRLILRREANRERRRAAWAAAAPLSQAVAPMTRELVAVRNAAARAEGYPTYAHMMLDFAGLQMEQTVSVLEELREASQPNFAAVTGAAAKRLGLAELQPWDMNFVLEGESGPPRKYLPKESILPRLEEWGRLHGRPLEASGITVHYLDIPFNGLCVGIRPKDIRILGNPSDGLNYYKTMFHELGHALHAAFSNPGSYMLRREPSVFNEGMAEIMGYVAHDPDWLAHIGLPAEEVAASVKGKLGSWFMYLRERSAFALFEYQMYANPDQDLDTLHAQTLGRFLGCAADRTPRWAANAWFSGYPVYWQNYVLADVIASQIHHDLRRRFGKATWGSLDAIAYVEEQYWAPGGRIDWQEKIRRGTGEDLNTRALVADLSV